MTKEYYKKYWKEVRHQAWLSAWDKSGIKALISILVVLLGSIALGGIPVMFSWVKYPFFRDNLLANSITGVSQTFMSVLILVALYLSSLYKIPPEMQRQKENEIIELDKRLSLREYDDIAISFYDYPWTDQQLRVLGSYPPNTLKLGLRLINSGGLKIRCALRMVELSYNGKGYVMDWSGDDWVDSVRPIEKKYIYWDEGYVVGEGKIDVSPNGGIGNLLFAESNPYAPEYWFWYLDGKGKTHQVLSGKYKAILQLEGNCFKNGVEFALQPVQYEIVYSYGSRRLVGVSVVKAKSQLATT